MSEYTKGPWEFDGEYVWAQSIRGYVASTETEDVMSGRCVPINMAADVAKANGLLIAAAPELLEACEAVMAWWEEHQYDSYGDAGDEYNVYDEDPEMVVKARAAIRKARNEG